MMDPEVIRAEQETDLAPKEVGRMLRSTLGQSGRADLNRLNRGLYDRHGLYDHSRTRTVD
jgi:hypothetical protein